MPEPTPSPGLVRRVTTFLVSDDEAVVYDPYKGELRKEKSDLVEKSTKYTKYDIPRFRSKVDIYLEIGPAKSKNNQLLATVNLKSLGFTMNMRRHLGDIKCIYVLKP